MSHIDDELGFTKESTKTRAPRVLKCVKQAREELFDIIASISPKKHAEKDLDILCTVATLLHENYSERLLGASMTKELNHGRLSIKIIFNKDK